jgi:uncharacterized cupin superfamily protein
MVIDTNQLSVTETEAPRGGNGVVRTRTILSECHPGSPLAGLVVNRLAPGSSIGIHPHHGEEDFYFCLSGTGVVHDNGVDRPFYPGVFQITRSGETQGLRNTGSEDLVFLGGLVKTS